MGTKTISITDEAYERLSTLKGTKESFSDAINLLTKKDSLLKLVGVLSKEEGDELKVHISDLRKRMRLEVDETSKLLR